MAGKVILKHSETADKTPSPANMSQGEVYVNSASDSGKSFLYTKKGEDNLAIFTEKDYNDSHYGSKTQLDTIASGCVLSAVMSESAPSPSVSENVLTIPTITRSTIQGMIDDDIADLNGSATIASAEGNVVTLKANVTETAGKISNGGQSDIVLASVAKSGSASDLSVTYNSNNTDTQTAVTNIASRLNSLETASHVNTIVCEPVASEIPNIATYRDGSTVITGTLEPSSGTTNTTYLVKNDDAYQQYTTTYSNGTYSWVDMGSTSVDLTGYIKEVQLNGSTYSATTGTLVALPNVITTITGEAELATGNTDYVSVTTTAGAASGGSKNVTLASKIKTQTVTASTESNDGVATAYDVKNYVQANLTTIKTWRDEDIIN